MDAAPDQEGISEPAIQFCNDSPEGSVYHLIVLHVQKPIFGTSGVRSGKQSCSNSCGKQTELFKAGWISGKGNALVLVHCLFAFANGN